MSTPVEDRERAENAEAQRRALTIRRGAGGTPGGIGTFFIGLLLAAAGGYLILNQVTVTSTWGYGSNWLGGHGGFGLVMLPFLIGVGLLFSSSKSWLGWAFTVAGTGIIIAAILMNMSIFFRPTSLYVTLIMFGMFAAGVGMILRSLRAYPP